MRESDNSMLQALRSATPGGSDCLPQDLRFTPPPHPRHTVVGFVVPVLVVCAALWLLLGGI